MLIIAFLTMFAAALVLGAVVSLIILTQGARQ